MRRIRDLRGARQRALPARRRCPASPTSTSARRRSPSASARRCARTTTSPAPTAATATAWPRAPPSTACSASSSARRRATAAARAAPCTSPTTRTGNLGANAIVGGSAGHRHRRRASRPRCAAPTRWRSASSARARWARASSTRSMNMAALWKLPGHLRLREQPLQRVHALLGDHRRRHRGARRRLRHPGRGGRRAGRPRRLRRRASRRSSARAPARAPPSSLCNTYRFHGHHVGDVDRAYYRSQGGGDGLVGERDPLALLAEWLRCRGRGRRRRALERIESEIARRGRGRRGASPLAAPFPDPGEVDEHVYP